MALRYYVSAGFHSVQLIICGIGELEQRKCWFVRLEGCFVLAGGCRVVCEFQCSRHNRSKGNVLYFGKSQQGFAFSGSRLTLEVWCIALDKICS